MGNTLTFYDIDIMPSKNGLFIYTQHPIFNENGKESENELLSFKYIKSIQRQLSCNHESDRILTLFSNYLLPSSIPILSKEKMFNKEGAIDLLKDEISCYQMGEDKKYLSFNDYIKRELLKFFLEAYSSEKTKFLLDDNKTDGLIVDLRETLSLLYFKPRKTPQGWRMITKEMYDLMKKILIQCCKIDSFEVAQIQYGIRGHYQTQKTITTACSNPYERFYNYYINGYRIDVLPQLKLKDGIYCFEEPISRYAWEEPTYREKIIQITGIDPEQYVIRPRKEIPPNDLIK